MRIIRLLNWLFDFLFVGSCLIFLIGCLAICGSLARKLLFPELGE